MLWSSDYVVMADGTKYSQEQWLNFWSHDLVGWPVWFISLSQRRGMVIK